MKTTLVRVAVLLLAVTGFGASRIASASAPNHTVEARTDPSGPIPMCPPNDPNGCGIH
jgi:hypothetical protein